MAFLWRRHRYGGASISGTVPAVADVAWTAYALAMFSDEQRAAAMSGQEAPDGEQTWDPIPPPPYVPTAAVAPPVRVTIDGISYDPNTPQQLAIIYSKGWRYEGGRWVAPGAEGRVRTAEEAARDGDPPGRLPGSLASVLPVSSAIAGASVLGTLVPLAPAVLLPSFVGGRLGIVRLGGGMRPESGGNPKRVIMGNTSVFPQVRMVGSGWGGGGGGGSSW